MAVGIAILIAVPVSPDTPPATLDTYRRATYIIAALARFAGLIGLVALARRVPAGEAPVAAAPASVEVVS